MLRFLRGPLAIAGLLPASVMAATLTFTSTALADGAYTAWKQGAPENHGSQVASSEWLPIVIGGAAGVIVGGLTGAAFDTAQPPIIGGLVGGAIGGVGGGGAGAWVIRGIREKDTRLAGTVTGAAIGLGVGVVLFTKINMYEPDNRGQDKIRPLEATGKFGALLILPLMGAFAGHRLAIVFGSTKTKEAEPVAPVAMIQPTVNPIMTGAHGTTGMTFGAEGFF